MRELHAALTVVGADVPKVFVTDRELSLMNALTVIFPTVHHLLCIWHINKNTLARIKTTVLGDGDLSTECIQAQAAVFNSLTEAELETNMGFFLNHASESVQAVGAYIRDQWLIYRDRCVRAWTNNIMHYNHSASSRVEGAHATLKKQLRSSQGDFNRVGFVIKFTFAEQLHEHSTMVASDAIRRLDFTRSNESALCINSCANQGSDPTDTPFKRYELFRIVRPLGLSRMSSFSHSSRCLVDRWLPL